MATKTCKKYSEYYQDEEFKNRQKEYLAQPVKCECGKTYTRSYIYQHRTTKVHERRLESLDKVVALENRKKSMAKHIEKIEAEMEKVDKTIERIKKRMINKMIYLLY